MERGRDEWRGKKMRGRERSGEGGRSGEGEEGVERERKEWRGRGRSGEGESEQEEGEVERVKEVEQSCSTRETSDAFRYPHYITGILHHTHMLRTMPSISRPTCMASLTVQFLRPYYMSQRVMQTKAIHSNLIYWCRFYDSHICRVACRTICVACTIAPHVIMMLRRHFALFPLTLLSLQQ